jgi:CheY-like chemotaxis protein
MGDNTTITGKKNSGIVGIPSNLYRQLRTVLLNCGPFATASELNAIFVEKRLVPWRNRLPEANSPTARVEGVIDFLHDQYSNTGENALVLFLRVLSERLDSEDTCHHSLVNLADELEHEAKSPDSDKFESSETLIQTISQDVGVPSVIEANDSKIEEYEKLPLIMVVDGDDNTRDLYEIIFSLIPARVVKAGSVLEASRILAQSRPDLIITEVMLPKLDGMSFIQGARANKDLATIPIIVIASVVTPDRRKRLEQVGANEIIQKPFEPTVLKNVMIRWLKDGSIRT